MSPRRAPPPAAAAALLILLACGAAAAMRAPPPAAQIGRGDAAGAGGAGGAGAGAGAGRAPRRAAGPARAALALAAEGDRVESLPGAPGLLDFDMFAGNVTVDADAGRALFYVFVERDVEPEAAPIVLWLNGGPGCSSLGGGFMSELGPFFPHHGGEELKPNPFAWNRGLANLLFLESPAFVGFSFSDRPQDAVVGDARTASDARAFLLGWLERFPQYADSDIFISGESYGGHYVPHLALEVVRGNARGREPRINLKGFLVGNAWTDAETDNKGTLDFWYSHALISAEAHEGIHKHCNFSNIGPLAAGAHALALSRSAGLRPGRAAAPLPQPGPEAAQSAALEAAQSAADEACEAFVSQAFDAIAGINIYDIYADVCNPEPPPPPPVAAGAAAATAPPAAGRYRGALLGHAPGPAPAGRAAGGSGLPDSAPGLSGLSGLSYPQPGRVPRYDPCIDNKVEVYLNNPEVQAALHANQTGQLPGPWQDCTPAIAYSRSDLLSSMLPVYKELIDSGGLQIWVFSGDVDGIVPILGSRRWIEGLGLPLKRAWRAWFSQTGQVGGWRVDYDSLSLVSVRNAGHMVPYTQPERGYNLLAQFLLEAGADLPPAPSAR
ncbi:serine carboxypeptidase-like [Raphidocelis subcapitata]|uniref:Carboxypeptidase n=1 Tax=Raphidocelis subcapitata TaxID=307507 RepID=A0A2V0NX08_9CHLO|nr:serine carboxypeptidase-like [Raphidocelis subcapitata]|eukprot:GBF89345.1 serine carboxypeptidase-like [Raphidocelis subcapitata]